MWNIIQKKSFFFFSILCDKWVTKLIMLYKKIHSIKLLNQVLCVSISKICAFLSNSSLEREQCGRALCLSLRAFHSAETGGFMAAGRLVAWSQVFWSGQQRPIQSCEKEPNPLSLTCDSGDTVKPRATPSPEINGHRGPDAPHSMLLTDCSF